MANKKLMPWIKDFPAASDNEWSAMDMSPGSPPGDFAALHFGFWRAVSFLAVPIKWCKVAAGLLDCRTAGFQLVKRRPTPAGKGGNTAGSKI